MARYRNPMYSGSTNPWASSFSNLSMALFGDPVAMQKQQAMDALVGSRQASEASTYDAVNRKLRADQALEQLGTQMKAALTTGEGGQVDPNAWAAAMPALAEMAVKSGYKGDLAKLFRMEGAYGGDSNAARRGLVGTGVDPGADFAITQSEAEQIQRHKPQKLTPGETLVMPAPVYPPDSMANVLHADQTDQMTSEPLPPPDQAGAAAAPASLSQPASIFDQFIVDAADTYQVPPDLLRAVARTESNFDPNATGQTVDVGHGPEQARGMMQWLPSSASDPGYGVEGFQPGDPSVDIPKAAQFLRGLYDKLGSWDAALAYYGGTRSGQSDYSKKILAQSGILDQPPETAGQDTTGGGGAMADIFSQGGQMTMPDKPREVSAGASLAAPGTGGKYETLYTAPPNPHAGGAGGRLHQPTPQQEGTILSQAAALAGVPTADLPNVLSALGVDGFGELTQIIDQTWTSSNGDIMQATSAAAQWLKNKHSITPSAPGSGSLWWKQPATPLTIAPLDTTPPAADAGTASAAEPPAGPQVGDVKPGPDGDYRWDGNLWQPI